MNVATFPPPSLQAQLDELRRERVERTRRYPMEVARRTLGDRNADQQNRALDGAIATLERLVATEGQPGRKELISALRGARMELGHARLMRLTPDEFTADPVVAAIDGILARIPE